MGGNNKIILTREKKDGKEYYNAEVIKVDSEHQIKVKWEWLGFSEGSISVVHVNWIQRDSARNGADHNYSEDSIVINMDSVGSPGVSARLVQANSI